LVILQDPDDDFLKAAHILVYICKDQVKIQDRIAHQLSRTVEGDIPSSVDFKILNLVLSPLLLIDPEVIFRSALAQGINRRMFTKDKIVALWKGIPCPLVFNKSPMQVCLEIPRLLVRQETGIDHFYYTPFLVVHTVKIILSPKALHPIFYYYVNN
jgi:hypothetical protein